MYKQILNAHALCSLCKLPEIPDFHLMVGSAEELAPLPLLVYATSQVPREVTKNLAKLDEVSNEDLMTAIADNEIEVNDLNDNMYLLGIAPLGGV